MNLRVLKPSRRAPQLGDVFAMLPPDGRYLFGRVVATDTTIGGFPGVLIYVYRQRSDRKDQVPNLTSDDLLVAPMGTNRLPWSRGYFETVEKRGLGPSDKLSQHCFRDSRGWFFDEYGSRLPEPIGIVGSWGMGSFRTVDDNISKALGIPLSPEE